MSTATFTTKRPASMFVKNMRITWTFAFLALVLLAVSSTYNSTWVLSLASAITAGVFLRRAFAFKNQEK